MYKGQNWSRNHAFIVKPLPHLRTKKAARKLPY